MGPAMRIRLQIAVWVSLFVLATAARAQTPPPRITSDTAEYCAALKQRFDGIARRAQTPVTAEVSELYIAGGRMCEHGQIRGGLLRLRRAIVILSHSPE